jgi:hypothetical protein
LSVEELAMRLPAIVVTLSITINLTLAVPTHASLPGYQTGATLNIDLPRRSVYRTIPQLQRNVTPWLNKRTDNFQIHHMKIHQMVIPIRFAANYLCQFYSRVLRDCLTHWVHAQPVPVFSITLGPFEMTFRSTLGPVPWSLVSEVAFNMLSVTALGFTGTYDMWYTDIQGVSVVVVAFRIRPDALIDLSVWLH